MPQMLPYKDKSPSTINTDDAIAMLPPGDRVLVVEASAISGKADVSHTWHKEFAQDKLRKNGAQRTYNAHYAAFPMYFIDDNGTTFYIQGQTRGE